MNRYSMRQLIKKYPFVKIYFEENNFHIENHLDISFRDFLDKYTEDEIEDLAIDKDRLEEDLRAYIAEMKVFLGIEENEIDYIDIYSGINKYGEGENFDKIRILRSEIITVVGATGSGKSRLLGDIEWMAQGDTPTRRKIYINGQRPDINLRYSAKNKLVAQLSQNMNFIMDLSVRDFLELHAESRMVEDVDQVIEEIIRVSNNLAGEKFHIDTPITSLSGGQSRALMIADTGILSNSPIVLIDEIENAGIDKKKALEFLVSSEKIVLMATHDPILALMGNRRIIVKNGGIDKIIETTDEERSILEELEKIDSLMQGMRNSLRNGEILKLERGDL